MKQDFKEFYDQLPDTHKQFLDAVAEQEVFDYTDEEDDDFHSALPEHYILDRDEVQEYHIRIKLNNSPFPIWREIKIPSNLTLEFFAIIIIEAMGWYNEHLHCFRTKEHTYKNTYCIKEDEKLNQMFGGSVKSLNTNDYTISDILVPKGKRITFEYDYGDGWEHEIWIKGVRPYEQGEEPAISFVKGKGTCPPENCGGVGGYAYLIDIWLKKRKKKEEKEQLEFYGIHELYNFDDVDAEGAQEVFDFLWQTVKKNNKV